MRVKDIEALLYQRFPAHQAEGWDHIGLSVGDPCAKVTGIACALDPLPQTIKDAKDQGCNVLVTHHPAYLDAPRLITPEASTSSLAAQSIWCAVEHQVSLIAMHTNLDRSSAALTLPSQLTGFPFMGRLQAPDGYGCILDATGFTLAQAAERFGHAYGAIPTIYGQADRPMAKVGFSSGSLGDIGLDAVAAGCDAVVSGEASYHRILDLTARGCEVILLGHDVSELPYAQLLALTLADLSLQVPVVTLSEYARWSLLLDSDAVGEAARVS